MATNLSHLQVGDYVAFNATSSRYSLGWAPKVKHSIQPVVRITPTQLVLKNGTRLDKATGRVKGEYFTHAIRVTPQILAQHDQETRMLSRYNAAYQQLDNLMGKHLHQLKLSVEQMEHLAKAWGEVQAMPPQPHPAMQSTPRPHCWHASQRWSEQQIQRWKESSERAEARIAELEKDAARLDYLIQNQAFVAEDADCKDGYWLKWEDANGKRWVQMSTHDTPRAAIDAAMSTKEST